jgi:hypothetical protein
MMSRKRKDVLEKIESLVPQVVRHVERVLADPANTSRRKWTNEALGWLLQMEALLRHVGQNTASEWKARIDDWRDALRETSDAE